MKRRSPASTPDGGGETLAAWESGGEGESGWGEERRNVPFYTLVEMAISSNFSGQKPNKLSKFGFSFSAVQGLGLC